MNQRIPKALQKIFLASNRGEEVHTPAPESSKTFRRFFRRRSAHQMTKRVPDCDATEATDAASVLANAAATATKEPMAIKTIEVVDLYPQDVLDELLFERNYSTEPFATKESAYYNFPSALQQASYTKYMMQLVKANDVEAFRKVLASGMVSPNPSNQFGESLLHMACRRGHVEILKLMLANGASVQIADDYGRTPMHDACWAATPNFELVDILLKQDPRFFQLTDARGALPLTYVKKSQDKRQWIAFFEANADKYWAPLPTKQGPPPLTMEPANSRAEVSAPSTPLGLVKAVAEGADWEEEDEDMESEYESDDEDSEFSESDEIDAEEEQLIQDTMAFMFL